MSIVKCTIQTKLTWFTNQDKWIEGSRGRIRVNRFLLTVGCARIIHNNTIFFISSVEKTRERCTGLKHEDMSITTTNCKWSPEINSRVRQSGASCLCSICVCKGFPWVLWLPPIVRRHAVRWIRDNETCVSVCLCILLYIGDLFRRLMYLPSV